MGKAIPVFFLVTGRNTKLKISKYETENIDSTICHVLLFITKNLFQKAFCELRSVFVGVGLSSLIAAVELQTNVHFSIYTNK